MSNIFIEFCSKVSCGVMSLKKTYMVKVIVMQQSNKFCLYSMHTTSFSIDAQKAIKMVKSSDQPSNFSV